MARGVILVRGDTAKPIRFWLEHAKQKESPDEPTVIVPQDLTGATVRAWLTDPETLVAVDDVACTVFDALGGGCEIAGSARASWAAAEYLAEFVVTYAGGGIDIFPSERKASITIRPRDTGPTP